MLKTPSKVYDKKYIRMPNRDKVIESDDEWSRCGKWILINFSGSMSWIDETWARLQVLLEKGCLIMIKASTAGMAHNPTEPGSIMCFTRPGEEEIERAAKEIRKIVHYEPCMYYKVNNVTESRIDHRYGHKRIPKYMHTLKGFFYRDSALGWVLVNDADRENQRKNISLERWNVENFIHAGFDQLLSRSSNVYHESNDLKLPTCSRFILHCSLEEIENCLSEADRLWIIGKKLIDKGIVHKITCVKSLNTASFHFLFLKKLNIESIVKLCDKIQEEAQVFRFIYIVTKDNHYRYSPEKELNSLPEYYKIYKAFSCRKENYDLGSEWIICD